jgi:hypothetical protein
MIPHLIAEKEAYTINGKKQSSYIWIVVLVVGLLAITNFT